MSRRRCIAIPTTTGARCDRQASPQPSSERSKAVSTDRTPAEDANPAAHPTGQPSEELARLAEAVRAIERGDHTTPQTERPAPPERPAAEAAPAAAQPSAPAAVRPVALSGEPVEAARQVLARGSAPQALAEPAVERLGERAGELLAEDPWLVLSLPGVRVDQADGFARTLLGASCRPDDERRGRAVVGWLLERAAEAGHTALEWSVLTTALQKQSVPDPDGTLRKAVEEGQLMVFHDEQEGAAPDDEAPVTLLLGLDRYALAEESLADGLVRLLNTFETAATPWEPSETESPSPSAAQLILAVAGSGLTAHTGGEAARAEPAALVAAARAAGLRAYAAAHTENGRRRLAELLGADGEQAAVTVDGLLSGGEGPGRGADGTLELDLLAVLDAPQLDVERAASLVESVPDGARLVLSGDPGVLWSAGPGRVFADLLAAKVCPQVASRTPDPGPIGELVSGIGIGELAQVEAPEREVVIVPVRDAGEAVHRTVQLVADSVPRALGVPAGQTQVITPGHGGAAGTRALNAALKERLNPGPGRYAGFDPGDRVVYVPGPGRALPGTVVSADSDGLRLDCEGGPVVVPREQVASAVRHGWAVTAHQAVGARWPAAVVVLPGDAAATLTRQWVYSAFSRAERHLSVVQGIDEALPRVVAEVPAKDRTTRLRTVLREQTAEG
ncbi:helix-hairpin-helix domain-containing protein [Streptomyces sp. RPT161]|uniref:helix-hairpin-helix domain-containing protein n=1 Tax=Streptomyces sp. RPT161 TaxID=3015993 RepID=UPI003FCCB398